MRMPWTTDQVKVIPAGVNDRPLVTRILASAFVAEPFAVGLLPRGPIDHRLLRLFARMTFEALRSGGMTYLAYTDGTPVGAALWQPPGTRVRKRTAILGAPTYLRVFGGRLVDAIRSQLAVECQRPTTPHWYLKALGVLPGKQGLGVGSALMRDRLAVADRHHHCAFLETSTDENVRFYQRFGFRVVNRTPTVGTATAMGLWRAPCGRV